MPAIPCIVIEIINDIERYFQSTLIIRHNLIKDNKFFVTKKKNLHNNYKTTN